MRKRWVERFWALGRWIEWYWSGAILKPPQKPLAGGAGTLPHHHMDEAAHTGDLYGVVLYIKDQTTSVWKYADQMSEPVLGFTHARALAIHVWSDMDMRIALIQNGWDCMVAVRVLDEQGRVIPEVDLVAWFSTADPGDARSLPSPAASRSFRRRQA